MNLTIIQRAKFALLYQKSRSARINDVTGRPEEYTEHSDGASIHQPAILELNGLRLTSGRPNSAAEAAKINEKIDAIMDETLQGMKP